MFLGFDPGSSKRFSWASLHIEAAGEFISLNTGVVSNASDAVRKFGRRAARLNPLGRALLPRCFGGQNVNGMQICSCAATNAEQSGSRTTAQ